MDLELYRALNGLAGRTVWFDTFLRWTAQDVPIVMALIVALVWFFPGDPTARAARQRVALYAVCAAVLGLALSQAIGHVWFRERPYVHHPAYLLIAPSGDPSFPSDHAVAGVALAVPFLLARRWIGAVLLGLALLVSLARVAVGTHYPGDILGGALLGLGAALAIWRVRARLDYPLGSCLLIARRLRLA